MKHVGRQPERLFITPSRPNPWYGQILGGRVEGVGIVGGDKLTAQQALALDKAGLPQDTETMTVYRQATSRELYWPTGAPPVFEFECPIVGRRLDKVRVIAPNGDAKLVRADGWASDPHKLNRTYIEKRKAGEI